MPNISVKDVPDNWAEALRQRAARNHRSLQGELMAIIEQAVHDAPSNIESRGLLSNLKRSGRTLGFDHFGHASTRQGWKTVEQVVAEMRALYPKPVPGAPLGADIIRADRDSR